MTEEKVKAEDTAEAAPEVGQAVEIPLHVLNEQQRKWDRERRDEAMEVADAVHGATVREMRTRHSRRVTKPMRPVDHAPNTKAKKAD